MSRIRIRSAFAFVPSYRSVKLDSVGLGKSTKCDEAEARGAPLPVGRRKRPTNPPRV